MYSQNIDKMKPSSGKQLAAKLSSKISRKAIISRPDKKKEPKWAKQGKASFSNHKGLAYDSSSS